LFHLIGYMGATLTELLMPCLMSTRHGFGRKIVTVGTDFLSLPNFEPPVDQAPSQQKHSENGSVQTLVAEFCHRPRVRRWETKLELA
jgi:hypothetical protein